MLQKYQSQFYIAQFIVIYHFIILPLKAIIDWKQTQDGQLQKKERQRAYVYSAHYQFNADILQRWTNAVQA